MSLSLILWSPFLLSVGSCFELFLDIELSSLGTHLPAHGKCQNPSKRNPLDHAELLNNYIVFRRGTFGFSLPTLLISPVSLVFPPAKEFSLLVTQRLLFSPPSNKAGNLVTHIISNRVIQLNETLKKSVSLQKSLML